MNEFKRGATFNVCGTVDKVYLAPSGKFASITLKAPGGKGNPVLHKVRAFADMVDQFGSVKPGQTVEIKGDVDREVLTDKARSEIKVDGYSVWQPVLTARSVRIEASAPAPSLDDDDIKF